MTKKSFLIALIFLFTMSLTAPAHCDDAIKKLGRGICNVITSPFELPLQMARTNHSEGPMAAATWGLLKGVGMVGLRALVGAYETVTFPIPFPRYYRPILKDPEFFFEQENW